jgi:phosphoribosylanthranilate isomerase
MAVDYGADALGLIFAKKSPRRVDVETARKIVASVPPFITTVGVFTEGTQVKELLDQVGFDLIQFHGLFCSEVITQFQERAIAVISVRPGVELPVEPPMPARAYLLDSFHPDLAGGSGTVFDWTVAKQANRWGPVILAGGLTADNLREAIEVVSPYAVDVCSSVEREKGVKDKDKVRRFIEIAKSI